ncbi:MAG: GTP-binding protein [archaeon]|nr:GTP-binding protein [archaeon]
MGNGKDLSVDIQEVLLKEGANEDEFKAILYCLLQDCQCFIYLIDITQENSFAAIKKLHGWIDKAQYPNLSIILASNKMDLDSQRKVSGYDITNFLDSNNYIKHVEISLKNGQNFSQLVDEVYSSLNDPNKKLAINLVSESPNAGKGATNEGVIKIILLGDSQVGKSAFLSRYFKNQFHEAFLSTIGMADENKLIKVGDHLIKLTVWDTAGQERFRSLPKKYYHKADAVLLLFDVTLPSSFDDVATWMADIPRSEDDQGLTIYLIGNKVDLIDKRVVSRESALEKAKVFKLKYFEVSCKLNLSISEVMSNLIVDTYSKINHVSDAFSLSPNASKKDKKGCC